MARDDNGKDTDRRALLRRAGPWATPALVLVEVILVVTGVLNLTQAVVVLVLLELLIGLTAISRVLLGVRSFRAQRTAGGDRWRAFEDALSEMMPRRVARFLLLEPRSWASLRKQRARRRARWSFGYARGLRPLFVAVLTLTFVELMVLELVLFLAVDSAVWRWVSIAVHVYALAWLASFWASFVANPHRVGEECLTLRDGLFSTVVIPFDSIATVATRTRPSPGFGGRTGVQIDEQASCLTLAIGSETNVALELAGSLQIDEVHRTGLRRVAVTVDDPKGFVSALNGRGTTEE